MENAKRIKLEMMELWKETFHDSSRYIELVFDTYFVPDNVFTRFHENRLIAAMLCVPYEYQILAKDGKKTVSRCMYLCGLATRPEYRRKGIMAELMEEAEERIRQRGYTMSFLIPADTHLREYYRRRGYRDASFRRRRRFQECQTVDNSSLNIYSIQRLIKEGDCGFVKSLAEWCHDLEKTDPHSRILHSRKDMMAVMQENENSIFLTENTFDLKNPILAKVVAVAFPEELEESIGNRMVVLAGMFVRKHEKWPKEMGMYGTMTLQEVEKAISSYYKGKVVELIEICDELQIPSTGEVPYAMVKTLDTNENSDENENIIFKISLMLD